MAVANEFPEDDPRLWPRTAGWAQDGAKFWEPDDLLFPPA